LPQAKPLQSRNAQLPLSLELWPKQLPLGMHNLWRGKKDEKEIIDKKD
jgi:hypothetical protein